MKRFSELLDEALEEGISVKWVRMAPGFSGAADLATLTIYLDWDLDSTPTDAVCVYMHERGHLALGHACSQSECGEKLADEWAARRLISPAEYALAENVAGSHPRALAQELGVTPTIVEAYQRLLARMAA